jgi:biopolymer transport protein ExbD
MKGFGKNKEEEQAGEIDLTPMLDVVFILLIFSLLPLYL